MDYRVQEDAIRTQENDISDADRGITLEVTKVSFALAFLSIVVVESLNFVMTKPLWFMIIFFGLAVATIASASLSLFAKKVDVHTDVGIIFIQKEEYSDWGAYLDHKHVRLSQIYQELINLLKRKASYTKIVFTLLAVLTLFLISGVFYG